MIQRIQSLYLLLAGIILLLCPFLPVADLLRGGHLMAVRLSGLLDEETGLMEQNLWLPTLVFLSGFLSIANIFIFKDRTRQIRIARLNIGVTILAAILTPIITFLQKTEIEDILIFRTPIVFPSIAGVFIFLAYRGIKKDDDLIKSADRLR